MDPVRHVYINGTERECLIRSFDLRETTNRVPIMSGDFLSADALFRPALDDEILILEDGDTIFGGVIDSAEESATEAQVAIASITTRVDAIGFSSFADRRYVNATLAAGTLKSQLTTLVAYLTAYGVSLDAGQVDGPSMPELVCEYRKLTDVLNDLSSLSSGSGGSPDAPYLWEIDYAKTLRMFQIGTSAAPVDLIEGAGVEVGDLVVKPTNQSYANRVILRSGGGLVTIVDDAAGQLAHGLREAMIDTQANLSTAVADQAAAGLLTQFSQAQIEARYSTVAQGIKPGQIQTITSAKRNVDASFLVTDVSTRQEPNSTRLLRSIVALAGYRLQGSWQDVLARWSNGSTGVGIPGSGGSGGFGTGSVGGGFEAGGGGGGSSCGDVCGGALAFSGYGDSAMKFYSPSGMQLTPPASAPWIGSSTGTGGCRGMISLADGRVGVTGADYPAPNFAHTVAFDPTFATILGYDVNNMSSIATDNVANFYAILLHLGSNYAIWKFTDGVASTTWDLGVLYNSGYPTLGMVDETVAYVYYNGPTIKKVDLSGPTVTTFATNSDATAVSSRNGILVLPNGNVLVAWCSGTSPYPSYVRMYAPDGSTIKDFTLSNPDNSTPLILTLGRLNGTSFWLSYYEYPVTTFSGVRVEEIDVISGSILNSFTPDDGSFEFDGPFCVLRAAAA